MSGHWKLIRRNLGRARGRLVLTVSGVGAGVLVLCVLLTVVHGLRRFTAQATAQPVIGVADRYGALGMPESHASLVRAMPGVVSAMRVNLGNGTYRDPKERIRLWAADAFAVESVLGGFPGFGSLARTDYERLSRNRRGALVGKALALRYGWQGGDTMALRGHFDDEDHEFELTVAAVIPPGFFDNAIVFHRELLQEKTLTHKGQVDLILLGATASEVSRLVSEIEEGFVNSAAPVRAIAASTLFSRLLAGTSLVGIATALSLLVFVAVTAIAANSVALSVRERTREVAVLRALGFSRRDVFGILVGESTLAALAGGVLGTFLAVAGFSTAGFVVKVGPLRYFEVPWTSIPLGLAFAVGVGVMAAVGPALRAVRFPIVQASRALP